MESIDNVVSAVVALHWILAVIGLVVIGVACAEFLSDRGRAL